MKDDEKALRISRISLELGERDNVPGLFRYAVFVGLAGIITLGCCYSLLINLGDLDSLIQPLRAIDSPILFQFALPYFFIATGAGLTLFGCLGAILQKRFTVKKAAIFGVLVLVLSAIQVFAAYSLRETLDLLLDKLISNPVSTEFGESEKDVLDFVSAVFNECCMTQYDSRNYTIGDEKVALFFIDEDGIEVTIDDNQRPVGLCQESLEATCPTTGEDAMFPDIITIVSGVVPQIADPLCACISSQTNYDVMVNELRKDDHALCNDYRELGVDDAGSVDIPSIPANFQSIVGIVQSFRPEYENSSDITRMNIVGKILAPEQTFNEPPEEPGYSCGLGYAKGSAFIIYLVIENAVYMAYLGALIVGGVCGLATVMFLYSLYNMRSYPDDESSVSSMTKVKVSNQKSSFASRMLEAQPPPSTSVMTRSSRVPSAVSDIKEEKGRSLQGTQVQQSLFSASPASPKASGLGGQQQKQSARAKFTQYPRAATNPLHEESDFDDIDI
eukprot:snap_masked-scaffold_5-processed-gene-13.50-mRNA-1 protein AED:1.00 eAED:1.00 QI:0/-1/0/0/-1/1/1/0/501